MARYQISHPSQPFPIRILLQAYEFCASLKLAVVLITLVTGTLVWATIVESNLGAEGARWYIYGTPFFLILHAALAVNIFCAAAIRYPWKRHQTGFVITHIGLLTLLAGSAIAWRGGVNSQMLVYLNGQSSTAVDHDLGYLVVERHPPVMGDDDPAPSATGATTPEADPADDETPSAKGTSSGKGTGSGKGPVERKALRPMTEGPGERLAFPVRFGPFNWADQEPSRVWRTLNTWRGKDNNQQPWKHPPELVYQQGDVKVEIVDYYARSEVKLLPFVALNFRQTQLGFEVPVELEYNRDFQCAMADFQGIGNILMWERTEEPTSFRAFTECIPQQSVEGDGAVVIWIDGEEDPIQLSVNKLQAAKKAGQPVEVTNNLSVELVKYAPTADLAALVQQRKLISQGNEPHMPAVELRFHRKTDTDDPSEPKEFTLIRFADLPFTPNPGTVPENVVAELYHPAMKGRIDILQGPKGKLAYRVWQQKLARVVATGPLNPYEPVSTWSMGGGQATWQMALERFEPVGPDALVLPDAKQTKYQVYPLPFDKSAEERGATQRVKVRVTWGSEPSQQREFWLRRNSPEPWQTAASMQFEKTDLPDGSSLIIQYKVQTTNVGFTLHLDKFDLEVDPGAPIAANYTSHVRITDQQTVAEAGFLTDLNRRVATLLASFSGQPTDSSRKITMNAPLDWTDPEGRMLRFFQENYLPPRENTPAGSVFRVNYNPGRWMIYLGSLLVVVGIFTMFYMRAYFFKKDEAPRTPRPSSPAPVPAMAKSSR